MPENYVEFDNFINADAGVRLGKLQEIALNNSLSGLEALSKIPGTLGGAIYNNSGAFNHSIGENVIEVCYYDGEIKYVKGDNCCFDYRKSVFRRTNNVILSAKLRLKRDNFIDILHKESEFTKKRRELQPQKVKCAGSVYLKSHDNSAGYLIDCCGLKGYRVGGAYVSKKHANFIINDGSATSNDIYKVMNYVEKCVYDAFGIVLEREIRLIGDFCELKNT